MATMYDVAREAGVSAKTVSRVLNGEQWVSGETKEKVLSAIRKLDYHPNAIAASLKKQRSNIIGFVIPYGSEFVFQDLNMMEQLRGAHDFLSQEGYDLLISVPVHKQDVINEISRLVKHKNVDGVILYPSSGIDQIIDEFIAKNFKYVTLGVYKEHQNNNYVDIDATSGVYWATQHLLSRGHRKIGVITRPDFFFNYEKDDQFLIGYKAALADLKIPFTEELVIKGDYSVEGGYQLLHKLLKLNPEMTAVICASDPMAYGVCRAIDDLGLKLGDDIQVIAGDNLPLTQKLYPYMPAIANPSYLQGREAGKMIVNVIREDKEVSGVTLKTEFVMRSRDINISI